MSGHDRRRRGLGAWSESYGVGMKTAPNLPPYPPRQRQPPLTWNPPSARDLIEQRLLDMARSVDPDPPVRSYEEIKRIGDQEAKRSTRKAGFFLFGLYAAAFAAWGPW